MKKIVLSALAALSLVSPAMAAGAMAPKADASEDFKAGDWMVRARALGVVPQESSTLSIGGSVHVNSNTVPEVDLSYFFTSNISAELIAAVTKHHVRTDKDVDAGSAWLLPPTLTLQYHFNQCTFMKPYVGAGVNYTHFYNAKAGALTSVSYEDSFGGALQAGVDIPIRDHWYANFDVKKVFISTTAKFSPSNIHANVDIDPWLIGVGIGYKF